VNRKSACSMEYKIERKDPTI